MQNLLKCIYLSFYMQVYSLIFFNSADRSSCGLHFCPLSDEFSCLSCFLCKLLIVSISQEMATAISAWSWVNYVNENRSLVVTRWIQPKRISCSEYTHPLTHLHSWEILKIRHQIQASPPVVSRHIRNTCGVWQVKDSSVEFRGCWQEVLQKERRGVRNVLG